MNCPKAVSSTSLIDSTKLLKYKVTFCSISLRYRRAPVTCFIPSTSKIRNIYPSGGTKNSQGWFLRSIRRIVSIWKMDSVWSLWGKMCMKWECTYLTSLLSAILSTDGKSPTKAHQFIFPIKLSTWCHQNWSIFWHSRPESADWPFLSFSRSPKQARSSSHVFRRPSLHRWLSSLTRILRV